MKIDKAARELMRDITGEVGHHPSVNEVHNWCDTYGIPARQRSQMLHLVLHG